MKLLADKARQKKIAEYRQEEADRERRRELESIRIYETPKDKKALAKTNPKLLD